MTRLHAEAEAAPLGSLPEAVARRDELILGLLVSNPLRAKNLITMTYSGLNLGGIYKTASGVWRIRIAGNQFKNRDRVGAESYDVPVASWLAGLVSDYVSTFRPRLLQGGKDRGYFFVSSRDGKRFSALNRQVFQVTKRYIPECGGISPHAFRHLVATDWLTKNPNDFVTVAELLNDTIEVVIKSYAHLKKETSFARYDEYIKQQIPNH
jgi:integrase